MWICNIRGGGDSGDFGSLIFREIFRLHFGGGGEEEEDVGTWGGMLV